MKRSKEEVAVSLQASGARRALEVIADKWTVLIIQALAPGTQRFNALHRQINGVTQKMLIQTLRDMERDGLVKRKIYPVVPPKVEYSLTPLGVSLSELTGLLCRWAEEHLGDLHAARENYDQRLQEENNLSEQEPL